MQSGCAAYPEQRVAGQEGVEMNAFVENAGPLAKSLAAALLLFSCAATRADDVPLAGEIDTLPVNVSPALFTGT